MKKSFSDIFEDQTRLAVKIPQSAYLHSGKYIIVDQGQKDIAGYSDNSEGLFTDIPAIVFGDHTRIIKYVDEHFFIGADGVKVLKSTIKNADCKYLFYALKNVKIPNTGYNRHFKWLKDSYIEIPNLQVQKQIAMRLDKIQELVSLQKEQIRKLEQLVKSRFLEMFGDPMLSTKFPRATLRNCGIWQTGGTPSRQHPEYFGGKQPWITTIALNKLYVGKENAVDFITDIGLKNSSTKIIPPNSLLFAIRVAVGRVSINICELCTNQDIVSLTLKSIKQWNLTYLYFMFRLSERYFIDKSRGATIKGITSDVIKDFPIIAAPLSLQKQFAEFVEKAETQKALLEKRLNRLETLYKSLMQQYFG